MPIPRDLSATVEADIQSLITEGARESSYLEFKRELPGGGGEARHELAADISAFGNSSGGDVIFGVDETDGQAFRIVPFSDDPDAAARRIQDMLLNGIEPRLPGIQVQPVQVSGGHVLIVRVPQSWAGPHRVKTNQHFFIRDNGRKRQLDVPEIRGLFLRSANQGQQLRDFRTDRLGKLLTDETPVRLVDGSVIVLHFVPVDAVLGILSIDPVLYQSTRQVPLLGTVGGHNRINIDGALSVRGENPEGKSHGYSQFFRNGYFESTKVLPPRNGGFPPVLPSVLYERELIDLVTRFRAELRYQGTSLDFAIMFSLIGANKAIFGLDRDRFLLDDHQGRFDRQTLVIPDVLVKGEEQPATALRPLFDLVWQAAGLEHSYNYDNAGNWVGR